MCLPGVVRGAVTDMKTNLDAITSMREAGIEMANKPLIDIRTKYNLALQQYEKVAQEGGDLNGVLAVTTALELLKSGSPFSPLSADPKIAKIQQTYQKAYEEIQKQTDARLLAVDRDYANQLDKLIRELTQAGSIEDAVKVREIKDQFIEDFKAAKAAKPQIPAKPIAARTPKSEGMRAGDERDFEIARGVKMTMCWIPPGEFVMGSPVGEMGRDGEETQHRVTLTKGFWMGKYEVTQEQWQAVMGNNTGDSKKNGNPVENVSWNDISTPGGFLEKANKNVTSGERFHLPTEAQWEYACRAGTLTSLNSGKEITTVKGNCRNLNEVAWYAANSERKSHPVGKKKTNAWGLYDMHGNVWEWCKDWKGAYPTEAVTDPQGADFGSNRIIRGGCWGSGANGCRVAYRVGNGLAVTYSRIGFRLARSSAP
jgi:formylglycine-generating enzyme required for sulfatase activity